MKKEKSRNRYNSFSDPIGIITYHIVTHWIYKFPLRIPRVVFVSR